MDVVRKDFNSGGESIMEVARVPQQPFTVVEGGSPGQMLKSARERMGLTIGDVCANLKMTERQIKAMEADTLEGIPPGGYARAFIKGYARFVGLNADLIVDSMMASSGVSPELTTSPTLMISPAVAAQRAQDEANESGDASLHSAPVSSHYNFGQLSSTSASSDGNLVKYSLIALVIGLLAYIIVPSLKEQRSKEVPTVTQIPQEVAIPAVNAELMPPNQNAPVTSGGTEPAFAPGTVLMPPQSVMPETQAPTPTAQPSPAAPAAAPVAQLPVVKPAPIAVQSKPEVLAPSAPTTALTPTPAPAPIAVAPRAVQSVAPTVAVAGPQKVRIQFVDRAYVTIRDRDGNVLLAQLNPANTDKVVEGNPPFKVIIGNAKAVKIDYKGKPLDLTTYTKDDVARFVIE